MRIQIILCNLRMKKLIFCLLLLPAFTEVNLCAWNKREHAAIAIIAENHLSPKAKKMFVKYPAATWLRKHHIWMSIEIPCSQSGTCCA